MVWFCVLNRNKYEQKRSAL